MKKTYIEVNIDPNDELFGKNKTEALERAINSGLSKATKIKVIVLVEFEE